jgi:hypothetical protein
MRRPCTFKKTDVTRAAKAALAAGLDIASVEIDPSGKIIIMTKEPSAAKEPTNKLDKWIESHARQA